MASIHKVAGRPFYFVKTFDPHTGAQVKRSTGTGDIRAARRFAAQLQNELLHPPSVLSKVSPPPEAAAVPSGPTVAALMTTWLDDRARRGVKSVRNDRSRCQNHILPALGSRVASEIRPREVRAFIADLRARGLAARTIRNVWTILRRFFADLEANEDIPTSPCKLLRGDLPAIEDKNPEWRVGARLTRSEKAERILASRLIPPDRRVMYTLLFCAGLRQGEVAALRWRHVDATREPLGALVIANTGTSSGTKTGVTREIPIHPLLAQVLADWRERGWVAMNKRAAKPDDLVVPSREAPEQVRRPQPMWERWKDDLKRLGLHHRDMHATRRTFMDFGLEAGVAEEVLLHLTHTPRKTMVNAYGRRPWKQLCDVVLAIEIALPASEKGECAA